jgi:hypothetical protein
MMAQKGPKLVRGGGGDDDDDDDDDDDSVLTLSFKIWL